MKKITFLYFMFSSFIVSAQEDAWVYFANKPDATYYLENPLEMLSQRALDRRTAQNIALDDKDVPIALSYINQVTMSPGITVKAKSKWLNALHIRGTIEAIQNLENFDFVDRVDFANRTLNTSGRASRIDESKNVKNDFETFLKQHPNINTILFNGQKAAAFFKKYVHLKNTYTLITLPSTSPANAGKTFQDKLNEWNIIKTLL
mgnify:CR=1 FL=1